MAIKVDRFWCFAPIALAVALAGCTEGIRITANQTGSTIAFNIDASRGGAEKPCVTTLQIFPEKDDGPDAIWYINTAEQTLCVNRFIYGRVPSGFDQGGPAPQLVTGRTYRVVASGTGFMGVRFFTPRQGDGEIDHEGPNGEPTPGNAMGDDTNSAAQPTP